MFEQFVIFILNRSVKKMITTDQGRYQLGNLLYFKSVRDEKYNYHDPEIALIPISRVMSCSWQENRIIKARRLLNEKNTPPNIRVVQIILNGDSYYEIDDGHHRSESYREAGIPYIQAKIIDKRYVEKSEYISIIKRIYRL